MKETFKTQDSFVVPKHIPGCGREGTTAENDSRACQLRGSSQRAAKTSHPPCGYRAKSPTAGEAAQGAGELCWFTFHSCGTSGPFQRTRGKVPSDQCHSTAMWESWSSKPSLSQSHNSPVRSRPWQVSRSGGRDILGLLPSSVQWVQGRSTNFLQSRKQVDKQQHHHTALHLCTHLRTCKCPGWLQAPDSLSGGSVSLLLHGHELRI